MRRITPLIVLATLILTTLVPAADDRMKVPPPGEIDKATKTVSTLR